MSRAVRLSPRGPLAALRRALVTLVAVLTLVAPSLGWAGTPYSVRWRMTEENPRCETAALGEHDGDAFFSVNETALPTHELPGAFTIHADGSESNVAEAAFDSVLLRLGANAFLFNVMNSGGNDWCVRSHSLVSLVSAPLGLNKPLFDIRRDGTAFVGISEVDLGLAEINPPLARDIVTLETAIARERKALVQNAAKVADLALRASALEALDRELRDLVERPLDEIARTDLDAILDRYTRTVGPETRAALQQLIDDLKQSVTDLEEELARLIDEFGAQADSVADLATGEAREAGWNPDDPSNYALGEGEVPWVEVPDLSDVPGAFSEGRDPYAAYADAVIAALEADVSDGRVIARADFIANVRAWRTNDAALEEALLERVGVSLAETNAFLNARNRVTAYVRRFMDASGWFQDTPVPPQLRAHVDGVLRPRFNALAERLKDHLNLWEGSALDLERTQLAETITAFAGAMSTIGDGFAAYGEVMATLVHATSRVGIGFVPFVGPALDLCEAVTGKAWCLPSGHELSDEERIFSGLGFGLGSVGPLWRGVKSSGLRPAAIRVAGSLAEIDEAFAAAMRASRRTWYKTLRGAVTSKPVNDFEKKASKFMLEDGRALLGVGDDGVRKVLEIPTDAPGDLAKAPDFLSVSRGNKLVLSEVKGGANVPIGTALKQLRNAMKALEKKGLAGDVDRVELIMKEGMGFDDPKYTIRDGYLFDLTEGETVRLDGFNKFIMVIRL